MSRRRADLHDRNLVRAKGPKDKAMESWRCPDCGSTVTTWRRYCTYPRESDEALARVQGDCRELLARRVLES